MKLRNSRISPRATIWPGNNLAVHVDGARFANAVVSAGCTPAQLTWKAGVDVLVFGGTKNGLAFGEAVVFFKNQGVSDFMYRMKQSGQLASKMRFLAAQWLGLLTDEKWLEYARHANAMAERLYLQLGRLPAVKVLFPREGNAVFAIIPAAALVEDLTAQRTAAMRAVLATRPDVALVVAAHALALQVCYETPCYNVAAPCR